MRKEGKSRDAIPQILCYIVCIEVQEDGLPAQGSIMTVDTLQIPYGAADFTPERDFSNISYDELIDTVELISNEVDVNVHGTYSKRHDQRWK